MRVGVGFSEDPHSSAAGKQAAAIAREKAGRTTPCDVVLLSSTPRHNQAELRKAVAEETGNHDRIYGGGSVGIITNEKFGYAGDQVGVACIWLDGAEWQVYSGKGASGSEEALGIELGKKLAEQGLTPESPTMFFYLSEQNVAKILELDIESIAIRHELEQKRRGFGLLAELSVSLRQETDYDSVLLMVSQRINAALNMQRTVVLTVDQDGTFTPRLTRGYTPEEQEQLEGRHLKVDPVMLNPWNTVVVTAANDDDYLADVRKALKLPYFISAPLVVKDEIVALLVTGRLEESVPFLSRLGASEAETVQAIAAVMATVMVYQRWDAADRKAQRDSLTGLLNRAAFEEETTTSLQQARNNPDKVAAFLMVDIDKFKDVNDSYGHIQGDVVLKALASTLQDNFRSSDIVSRLGGDEFAVFCPSIGNTEQIVRTADRLNDLWRKTPLCTEDGVRFYATLSIGIAVSPRDGVCYHDLLQKADIALYQAKHQGRNRFVIYEG